VTGRIDRPELVTDPVSVEIPYRRLAAPARIGAPCPQVDERDEPWTHPSLDAGSAITHGQLLDPETARTAGTGTTI
jgi:hypothetical protein